MKMKALFTLCLMSCLLASQAFAVPLDLSTLTVDTTSVTTLAGIVVAGLAGIWGLRKVVKFINRS